MASMLAELERTQQRSRKLPHGFRNREVALTIAGNRAVNTGVRQQVRRCSDGLWRIAAAEVRRG